MGINTLSSSSPLQYLLFINIARSEIFSLPFATKFEPTNFASRIRQAPKTHFEPLTHCLTRCLFSLPNSAFESVRNFEVEYCSPKKTRSSTPQDPHSNKPQRSTSSHSFDSAWLPKMPEKYCHKTLCSRCVKFSPTFDALVDCTVATAYNDTHTFDMDNTINPIHCKKIVRVDICKLCKAAEEREAAELRFKAASALLEMGDQGPSGGNATGSGNQDQQQSQGSDGSGGRGDHF
jgi:hypothetical protein